MSSLLKDLRIWRAGLDAKAEFDFGRAATNEAEAKNARSSADLARKQALEIEVVIAWIEQRQAAASVDSSPPIEPGRDEVPA